MVRLGVRRRGCKTTYASIYDRILAAEDKHGLLRVACVGDLFVPEAVGRPVEVPLQEVGYPELGAYEVLDDKV